MNNREAELIALRVLLIHNFYQQPGGEDSVFRNESGLLRDRGHEIYEYTDHNDRIHNFGHLHLAAATLWNRNTRHKLASILRDFNPDIAHFHNTFPLVSPAAYYACRDEGVPVVQTLHNYRLLCPAANFYRAGAVCEECIGKSIPWPSLLYGCYRDSRFATAGVAAMLTVHRARGTWTEMVNTYIALSEFSRTKFIEGGLPKSKLTVKPNFLSIDPGLSNQSGDYVISIGRLSVEKGTRNLISAWQQLPTQIPLRVYGDGLLSGESRERATNLGLNSISFYGQVPQEESIQALKAARFIVVPSGCYENFPMSILEAFACGIPALVSNRGAMPEIVEDGVTGVHFDAANPTDIAAKVEWAWTHAKDMEIMGRKARQQFERRYCADANYSQLLAIYRHASLKNQRSHVSF